MVEVPRLLVTLPPFQEALENLVQGHSLKKSYERLSLAYRAGESSALLKERSDYLAYAAARMPATYAVLEKVLGEVKKRYPYEIKTFLDLGCGPGSAYFAHPFSLKSYIAVERDPSFIALAKELGMKATFVQNSLELYDFKPVDLALFSYVIAEIKDYLPLVLKAYAAADVLVVVEPGTPRGFERIRAIREALIKEGAYMLAPCPSIRPCPMKGDKWCHFSQRLSRSRLHKLLKGGELGFEDEKYSYIAFSKKPGNPCYARLIESPHVMKGKALLPVCLDCELKMVKVKKTKLKWGEALESFDAKPAEEDEKGDGKS